MKRAEAQRFYDFHCVCVKLPVDISRQPLLAQKQSVFRFNRYQAMSQQMKKTMRRSVPNVNAGSEPRFEMDDQEDSALSFPFIPRTSSTVATDNAAAIVLAINWPALSR